MEVILAAVTQVAAATYPLPIGEVVDTKGITKAAGVITTKAGIVMVEITIGAGAAMAVVGTKTASCSYAGKPSLRHVPGVGAQSCTDARTGPPRHAS